MTKLSEVTSIKVPEGDVFEVRAGGALLWKRALAGYVSLGDSIAAGHTINDDWEADYGTGSQYGENGNASTVIVPGSYTNLIMGELAGRYGANRVSATSFAQSGDRVDDLINKLSHEEVRNAIARADIVTVCIGANDVLEPALSHLEEYINAGDAVLDEIAATVEGNLATLDNDASPVSYKALFDKLTDINPNAKYVFMTVYNPYKYLWLDESKGGFFGPMLNSIPQMTLLGFIEVDELIKSDLLNTSAVQTLFARVNGLCDWAEKYVSALNAVLRSKIGSYQAVNPNFSLTDAKLLFETIPDRTYSAAHHYNDLVSVEYTRGYDTAQMNWGALWGSEDVGTYWLNLATKYVSASGFDISGFANDLIGQVVEKVVVPDVDPHPEEYGHYVLKRAFADALGWQPLTRYRITYGANGGAGSMPAQEVACVGDMAAFVTIQENAFAAGAEGYYFTGWNTAADGSGTAYASGQAISLAGNLTLYAQWSNLYTVRYMHTNHADKLLYPDDKNTGHQECYDLWIDGQQMPDFGVFTNAVTEYKLPYNAHIGVVVSSYNPSEITYDDATCSVYWNGEVVASGHGGTSYLFHLDRNITIDFRWKIAGSIATFNAQSWEDCHITTW